MLCPFILDEGEASRKEHSCEVSRRFGLRNIELNVRTIGAMDYFKVIRWQVLLRE